jgi:hypothetical protein
MGEENQYLQQLLFQTIRANELQLQKIDLVSASLEKEKRITELDNSKVAYVQAKRTVQWNL